MAINNRSRVFIPRERFVYVAIIPWQPVDNCYMSCHAHANVRCYWSIVTKFLLVHLILDTTVAYSFLLRYRNFSLLVCALTVDQFVVLIIDTVWVRHV